MTENQIQLCLNVLNACEYYIPDDKHDIQFNLSKVQTLLRKERDSVSEGLPLRKKSPLEMGYPCIGCTKASKEQCEKCTRSIKHSDNSFIS